MCFPGGLTECSSLCYGECHYSNMASSPGINQIATGSSYEPVLGSLGRRFRANYSIEFAPLQYYGAEVNIQCLHHFSTSVRYECASFSLHHFSITLHRWIFTLHHFSITVQRLTFSVYTASVLRCGMSAPHSVLITSVLRRRGEWIFTLHTSVLRFGG